MPSQVFTAERSAVIAHLPSMEEDGPGVGSDQGGGRPPTGFFETTSAGVLHHHNHLKSLSVLPE
jgi:hypothetical protein